jgi:hypothetical protein
MSEVGSVTPSTYDTIEWVNQHHYEADDGRSCANCGGQWPCVPFRLADEIERMREALERIAKVPCTELHTGDCGACVCCIARAALDKEGGVDE